jgi:hypothetical protein
MSYTNAPASEIVAANLLVVIMAAAT